MTRRLHWHSVLMKQAAQDFPRIENGRDRSLRLGYSVRLARLLAHAYTVAFIAFAMFWVKALRATMRTVQAGLLTLSTLTIGCRFCDLAARTNLPQFYRIILASSRVLSIVLFSLDARYHADVDAPGAINDVKSPTSIDEVAAS